MKHLFARYLLVALAVCGISASVLNPASAQVTTEQLKAFEWRAIGPAATGGRILDIDVDPRNPFVIYAAAASGGLWKTVNNGTTWTCVFEKEGTMSIGDIAVDPTNPDTIWVGSGEANNQRSSLYGDGIYKSTDGGRTWEHKGLRNTQHIGRVVVHPEDSNTVYVASPGNEYSFSEERGVYKTTDGGDTWEKVLYINPAVGVIDLVIDPQDPDTLFAASYERLRRAWDFDGAGPGSGIWRTTDGGANWERLEGGLPSGEIGRIGLTIYPPDPNIVYATVPNDNTSPEAPGIPGDDEFTISDEGLQTPYGMFLFEDGLPRVVSVEQNSASAQAGLRADDVVESFGGETITDAMTLKERLQSARPGDTATWSIRRNGQTREITFTIPRGRAGTVGGEVYKTEDGGDTWTKVNDEPVSGSPDYYYGQIRVDPQDVNRLYMLSVPVYVSDDGGKTWSQNGASSVHVDHHALWINPNDSNHVILGNDGGFHVSYDRCATWDRINNIPLPQFYAIGYDMQNPYHVFGGTQDNGTWGGPSSGGANNEDWYRVRGGYGICVQRGPNAHNIIISESQFGAIGRLDKSTGRRVSIRPPQTEGGVPDRYNWNSPILLSHHDSRIVYFGGNKLFKSFNRGDDWLVISPDLTTSNPARISGNVPYCTITTIAESPIDGDMLLVGTDDGNVQWSNDGGENWTNMANRFPLRPADWWCTRVELSRHDRDTAYVSFSGYRDDDFRPFVFKTTDGGETWQTIISGLPSFGPVNVVKEDAHNPNLLYCGTDFGTFVSLDAGEHWAELTNNCPHVAVHDLFVHPRENELVIGTHGRGFFIVDVEPLQALTEEALEQPAFLMPIEDIVGAVPFGFGGRGGGGGLGDGDRPFVAPASAGGVASSYDLQAAAEGDVTLRIVNDEGNAVRTLEPTNESGINIVRWDGRGQAGQAGRGGRRGRGAQGRGRGRGRFGRGGAGGGQPLAPGDYAIELQVGDETYRQEFEVRAAAPAVQNFDPTEDELEDRENGASVDR